MIPLARTFAEQLPATLVGGSAIAAFAWVWLRFAKRQSSGARFGVWLSALLAMLILLVCGIHRFDLQAVSGASSTLKAPIELPPSWAFYVFGIWALGAGLALARLCVGLWQVQTLRKSCAPIDFARLDPELRSELSRHISLRRTVLCVSDEARVPLAVGFFRPAIVIPVWLIDELSPNELKQIVLHELGHLRRFDDWTNLLQRIACALLFFHPAAWWLEKKLSIERENACDDFVLEQTADPTAYARCLATLAEKTFLRRSMALAQAAISRVGQTTLRVSRILHLDGATVPRSWKPGVALVAIFSVACVTYQWHAPALILFQEGGSNAVPAVQQAKLTAPVGMPMVLPRSSAQPRQRVKPRAATFAKAPRPDALPVTAVEESAQVLAPQEVRADFSRRQSTASEPGITLAKATEPSARQVTAESVLLVVHDEQGGEETVASWRVTVWHVVIYSEVNPARKAITQKIT